ncbi:T9SS type A sorting domain-containing protein [candidate division KSB1 bacterium]|nr:T9SS type A sorting domain-containing protein [candidate division KSB1 bacterium]
MFLFKTGFFLVYMLIIAIAAPAKEFIVITTADEGQGSFPWALEQSNNSTGEDTVIFAIPYSDPGFDSHSGIWTILPEKPLPSLQDDGTFIDALSQARTIGESNADGLLICINGEKLPTSTPCFEILSAYNHILGFCIFSFQQHSIHITGSGAHHNRISGCFLGVGEDALRAKGKSVNGIVLNNGTHNNIIGGAHALYRNVLCAFESYAIRMENTRANKILGNYIGINALGNALGNGSLQTGRTNRFHGGGVHLGENSHNNSIGSKQAGSGNVISGNYGDAVVIESAKADSNRIQGNIIGLDIHANQVIANHGNGVVIRKPQNSSSGPAFNTIGGSGETTANIIAGNYENGILIENGGSDNRIEGNLIGIGRGTPGGLGNKRYGIYLRAAEDEVVENNIIGPNNRIETSNYAMPQDTSAAIGFQGAGVRHNQILKNRIGMDASGGIVNYAAGIRIEKGQDNMIGPDNLICSRNNSAIAIVGEKAKGNRASRNRFFIEEGQFFRYMPDSLAPPAPEIEYSGNDRIEGRTLPGGLLEIFAGGESSIHRFLGSCRADSLGRFELQAVLDTTHYVATVTDKSGTTSKPTKPLQVYCVLNRFNAEYSENRVIIRWETRFEIDNFGFYLQKSTDQIYWQDMGFIAGTGTSRERQQYSFNDQVEKPGNYYYRLRQVNFTGKESLSNVAQVTVPEPPSCQLMAPYPNPFNANTQIRFTLLKPDRVLLTVLNLKGETVLRLMDERLSPGEYTAMWRGVDQNNHSVASGVYIIHLQSESGASQSAKIVYSK